MITQISNPVFMAMGLILLRGLTGICLSLTLNLWLLLALLLIFLGGIIVIFIYVTTLAGPSKIILPSSNPSILLLLTGSFLLFSLGPYSNFSPIYLSIGTFYTTASGSVLGFLTLYLLIALLAIVKLSATHKGALVSWN